MSGLLMAALAAAASGAAEPSQAMLLAQLTVRSRIVIRIRSAPAPPPALVEFREKKGPRCVPMAAIVGAAVMAPNGVDFMLRGGARVRARFDASCPGLDYYSGFYLTPGADGQVCGGRDVVHSRAGGDCAIDRFRTLLPRKR